MISEEVLRRQLPNLDEAEAWMAFFAVNPFGSWRGDSSVCTIDDFKTVTVLVENLTALLQNISPGMREFIWEEDAVDDGLARAFRIMIDKGNNETDLPSYKLVWYEETADEYMVQRSEIEIGFHNGEISGRRWMSYFNGGVEQAIEANFFERIIREQVTPVQYELQRKEAFEMVEYFPLLIEFYLPEEFDGLMDTGE